MWKDGLWHQLVDQALVSENYISEVSRCIHIALLCVQENVADRPTMSDVVAMLSSNAALPEPTHPAYFHMRTTEGGFTNAEPFSVNDVTVSALDGR